jgi:hypothetical protein
MGHGVRRQHGQVVTALQQRACERSVEVDSLDRRSGEDDVAHGRVIGD